MKVAVSIPDPIFAQAEGLAKRLKLSRSKVYARALDEFVSSHSEDEITRLANAMADEPDEADEILLRAGARTALDHSEW